MNAIDLDNPLPVIWFRMTDRQRREIYSVYWLGFGFRHPVDFLTCQELVMWVFSLTHTQKDTIRRELASWQFLDALPECYLAEVSRGPEVVDLTKEDVILID